MKEPIRKLLNLKRIVYSCCFLLFTNLLSFLLIKFSGNIASLFNEEVGKILLQLRTCNITIPFYVSIIFLIINFVVFFFLEKHKVITIILSILIVFFTFVLTILLTKSNGIPFIKIVSKVIDLLAKGGIKL